MRSLTAKLVLAFLAVGLTGTVLVSVFVGQRARREFGRFMVDRDRAEMAANLATFYEASGGWNALDPASVDTAFGLWGLGELSRGRLLLADQEGHVLIGPRRLPPGVSLPAVDLERAAPIRSSGQTVGYLLFLEPGRPPPGSPSPESSFLARVNRAVLFGAVGATVAALLVGVLLAGAISRPVKALMAGMQTVAQGELGHQVAVHGSDELGQLAVSFNRMSADLADASRLRRQMTADIAHDLRTPATVLLGYAEGLADGKFQGTPEVYASILEEASHLRHLIEDLRTLSLADAGDLVLQKAPCEPRTLLERAVAMHAPAAAEKGVHLRVTAPEGLPLVSADPERMTQVLGNLVGNALRHTAPGGAVTLSAEAADQAMQLAVADDGEGIAADDLPHIFERHYRASHARTTGEGSSGLGLAIARSIVEAHDGAIAVQSTPGAGSRFTIALPL